jgi:hypothetical protein
VSVPGVILGSMEAGNPAWVPGEAELEARERLLYGATGLYGDLPPGVGPLLEVAAGLVAHAFAAFAEGDWETCDGLVTEGRHACGDVFTAFVEHIASPGWPYRVDSPYWENFIAVLATAVLRPEPEPAAPLPPAPPPAEPVNLADELRAMGLM